MTRGSGSDGLRRILVLGATGATGREVVDQALAAGHHVTAFVRQPPMLDTVVGDPVDDVAALAVAAKGQDAVISALGNTLALRDGRHPKILARAARTLVGAAADAGVARAVVMLSYGSAATAPLAPPLIRLLGKTVLRKDFDDLARAVRVLESSTLDWTVCHFGALVDGPRTGLATASAALTRPAAYRIRRADLAEVLLRVALTDAHPKRSVVVSGPAARS